MDAVIDWTHVQLWTLSWGGDTTSSTSSSHRNLNKHQQQLHSDQLNASLLCVEKVCPLMLEKYSTLFFLEH